MSDFKKDYETRTEMYDELVEECGELRADLKWALNNLYKFYDEFDSPDYAKGLAKVQEVRKKHLLPLEDG